MAASGDKALLAAASMLMDSARSMEYVSEKLESIAEQQAAVLDRLSDKLDKMGGKAGGAAGGEDKALGGLTKGFKGLTDSLKSLGESGGAIGAGFKALNSGLKDLSTALKVYAKIPKDSVENLTKFLKDVSGEFAELDSKAIKEGSQSVELMGKSLAFFGVVLLLSSPVYAIAAVGSMIIIPMVAGYAYLFAKLGDKEVVERVDAGANSMLNMAIGLASFALGLFAVKQLAGGDWGEFAKGALIVAVGAFAFSGLFYMLGGKEYAERVENGSKALAFTGVALASLALGIWAFQALQVGAPAILMAGLAVGVVGLAFGIIGMFDDTIEKGATGLILSGVALASLALGIWVFQKMEISAGDVGIAALAVGLLGILFGVAGMVAGEIALGALAFLGVAIAVIAVGYGMKMFKENKIELEDIGMVSGALVALGLVMAGAGVMSFFIIPGAAALILSGFALVSIAKGLTAFRDVDFAEDDADKMTYVISSLAASFSLAGGKEGMSSFLGISVGKNAVERGISSVMDAGDALASIAKGLVAFRALKLGKDEAVDLWGDGTLENPGSIGLVISGISAQFGAIGAKASVKSVGLLGLLGYQRNDVETGISAVMKTGEALSSIAKGVKAFMKDTAGIDVQQFYYSISMVVGAISKAFAEVGGASNSRASGGILGLLGVERNSVEEGISAVKDVGSTLVDLAAGVKAFANLTFIDPNTGKTVAMTSKDLAQVQLNIMSVLTSVSAAFGVIGAGKTQDAFGGLFGAGDLPVKKGVDAVKGVGSTLVDLAKGVADFAALKFTDPITKKVVLITPAMFGPDGTISKNIMAVVTSVSDVFGKIGEQQVSGGGWFGGKENPVALGIDAVKGIGSELLKIAEGVKVFAGIADVQKTKKSIYELVTIVPGAFFVAYNKYIKNFPKDAMSKIKTMNSVLSDFVGVFKDMPEAMDKKATMLSTVFSSVSAGFAQFGTLQTEKVEEAVSFMERLAKTSDPLTKLADSFERIAKSMDKFSATFKKMDGKTVKTSDMLIQSLVTFAKVDPNAFNTLTDKGKQLINFIYERGAKAPEATVTRPEPQSTAIHAEPGKTPVATATKASEKSTAIAESAAQNVKMQEMMLTLTTNMGNMAKALKDIHMLLQGELKVRTVS